METICETSHISYSNMDGWNVLIKSEDVISFLFAGLGVFALVYLLYWVGSIWTSK